MSKKDKKNPIGTINTNDGRVREGAIEFPYFSALKKPDEAPRTPDRALRKWPDGSGVFFGGLNQFQQGYYIGMPEGEDGNIIVIGGNGSGKTTGIVMPTLRTWKGPMCATDIKGELSTRYKEMYEKGVVTRPFIVFDPMREDCPKYDPFYELRQDDPSNLLSDIRAIVFALHPPLPNESQPFWSNSERAALTAGLLYYYNKGLNFIESIIQITSQPLSELCEELEGGEDEDVHISMLLGELRKTSRELRANIDRGLRNILSPLVEDPHFINAFMVKSDEEPGLTWDDLEERNIFLRIPADRVDTCGPQINLMYSQLIRHLERRPEKYSPEGCNNAQTLLLMDEFARFGKLESITNSIAILRSKSVNFCLIVQSIAQLDKIYGDYDRRIIFDNCQYKAILQANDAETQQYLSNLIGTRICIRNSVSIQIDEDKEITGYSAQISEERELAVCPHELSALTDVLLQTPCGVYRLSKLLPISSIDQNEVKYDNE